MFWALGILVLFLIWLCQSQLYRLRFSKPIPENYSEKLSQLGAQSVASLDTPIGAILVYKGEIIGEGFNTVKKDKRLSSHAEINAINMAFEKYSEAFFKLDRKELVLYSTFEPCPMCKGVLVNFNIRRVFFEGKKGLGEQAKWTLKELYYELTKRPLKNENIHQDLLLKHPNVRKQNGLD